MVLQNRGRRAIGSAREVVGRLCGVKALVPGLLFAVFVVAFVGLGAAANAHAPLLTVACVVAVFATLAALAASASSAERLVQHSTKAPGPVAWHSRQWAEFERAFWSHVEGSGNAPPRAQE